MLDRKLLIIKSLYKVIGLTSTTSTFEKAKGEAAKMDVAAQPNSNMRLRSI